MGNTQEEMICDKCNGFGRVIMYDVATNEMVMRASDIPREVTCSKCQGVGTVDWIDNILGKRSKRNMVGDWDNLTKSWKIIDISVTVPKEKI